MGSCQFFLESRSEDLQGGGVFSVVMGLYNDVHVLIEGDEEAQKALHGELAEVAAQHLGDIVGDQNPKRLALVESHFSQRTREMGHPASAAKAAVNFVERYRHD